MKITQPVVVLILLLTVQGAAAQWQRLTTGYAGNIEDVYFTHVDTGYAVGGSTILKTTNGGLTWTSQSVPPTHTLNAIFFPSSNVGFAVGDVVYRTVDAGATWDSVHVADEQWKAPEFRSLFFFSDSVGIVVGDAFRSTTDQGDTWIDGPYDFVMPGASTVIDFIGNGVGFLGGWTGTTIGMFGIVAKTTDLGKTWTQSLGMEDKSRGLRISSIEFVTPSVGWVVGSRESGNPPYSRTRILHTSDGGATWETINTVFARTLNTIEFTSDQIGYVGDDWGSIYSTTDGGLSWNADEIFSGGRSINAIVVVDRSVAYAVADDGLAFKRVIPTSVVDTFPVIGFRISPNPSHGSVTITIDPSQAPYQATRVTVFDALGRGVHQEWTTSDEMNFDFSTYPKGVYYIQVCNGTVSRALKLVVN